MADPADKGFSVDRLLGSLGGLLREISETSAKRQREGGDTGEKPAVDSRMTIRTLDGEPVEASFFGFASSDESTDADEEGEPAERPADFREPPVDIMVLADAVSAVVEVPGADPASVEITLEGDMLTVRAAGDRVEYRCEAMLPVEVEPLSRTKTMRNGILELHWRRPTASSKK